MLHATPRIESNRMLRAPVTIADGLLARILKAGDIYVIPPEADLFEIAF